MRPLTLKVRKSVGRIVACVHPQTVHVYICAVGDTRFEPKSARETSPLNGGVQK